MPNFEADDTGGGYAGATKNYSAGGTVLSGGSANTGNSLTRASVSSGPAGSPGYGGSGPITLGASSSGSGGPAANLGYGSPGSSISLGSGSSNGAARLSSGSIGAGSGGAGPIGSGGSNVLTGSAPSAVEPGMSVTVPIPQARPLTIGAGYDPDDYDGFQRTLDLQQGLIDAGAHINLDGKFGPQTKAALAAFKRERGIGGWAGFADEKTVAALSGISPTRSPRPPAAPLIPAPGETPAPATPVPAEKPLPSLDAMPRRTLDMGYPRLPGEEQPVPEKPLPGDVKVLPGDETFLATHPEYGERVGRDLRRGLPLITPPPAEPPLETLVRTPPDRPIGALPAAAPEDPRSVPVPGAITQADIEAAAERARVASRDAQLAAALPAPGSAASPNKLVAATVPYGEGVSPESATGLPPRTERMEPSVPPVEPKIETVEVNNDPNQPATPEEARRRYDFGANLKKGEQEFVRKMIEAGGDEDAIIDDMWRKAEAADAAAASREPGSKHGGLVEPTKPASLPKPNALTKESIPLNEKGEPTDVTVKDVDKAPKAPTPGAKGKTRVGPAPDSVRVIPLDRAEGQPEITPEIQADMNRYYDSLSEADKKTAREEGLAKSYFNPANQERWQASKAGLGEKPAAAAPKPKVSPPAEGAPGFLPENPKNAIDAPPAKAKGKRSDIESEGIGGEPVSVEGQEAVTPEVVEATIVQVAGDPDNPYGGDVDAHGLPLQTKDEKRGFTFDKDDPSARRYWMTRPEADDAERQLWWGPERSPEDIKESQERFWQDLEQAVPTHNQPMTKRETRGVQVAGAGDPGVREMPAFFGSVNTGRTAGGGMRVERGEEDIKPRRDDDMFHLLPTRHETTPARRPVGFVYNDIPPNTIYRAPDGTYRKKKQQEATA